ncbi:MAG TPA: DUF1080 domain-containing protein [Bacteroidales bacterium]|nr:DUF1080 domain-containing protein [Bacteroidales bacterium]
MRIIKLISFPFVVLLSVIILVAAGCRGGDHKTKAEPVIPEKKFDSTYLFNGISLDGWEITNFGPQGPVSVSGGEIILGMGDGCTGINYTREVPSKDYEISLEVRRREGNDFFCGLTFPVGNNFCTFIAGGWGGPITGLSCIDGKDASENETTTMRNFEKNRWYAIRLSVVENKIEVWIDEEKVVDFLTDGKKLSIRPEVNLSKPLGIASWNTTAGIRNIRLKDKS